MKHLISFILLCFVLKAQAQQVYIVNTTSDVTIGGCTTGHCTLREAITAANSDGQTSIIKFNFPTGSAPFTIQPTSALPPVSSSNTTIDGLLDNSYSLGDVILDGSLITAVAQGLQLTANDIEVYGLRIQRFTGNGIQVTPVSTSGIPFSYTIGAPAKGNIIVQNTQNGVMATNNASLTIQGNYVGVSTTLGTGLGNTGRGFLLRTAASSNSVIQIGGTAAGARNYIGENGNSGIEVMSAGTVTIQGNTIGTNTAGTANLGNGADGIFVDNQSGACTIGGSGTAANMIAFNTRGVNANNTGTVNITQNSIYCNGTAGITRTGNPAAPTVSVTSATTVLVSGTSSITPAGARVEVFKNSTTGCAGAPCQGKTYVGSTTTNTGGTWSLNVNGLVDAGESLTATVAVLSTNNTSVFSSCASVTCVTPSIAFSTVPACNGAATGQATATASGGVGPYTYQWSNSQTGPTISNVTPGVYSVTATDDAGCTATATVTVGNSTLSANAPDASGCLGSAINVNGNPSGTGALTHQWTDLGTGTSTGYTLSNITQQIVTVNTSGATAGTINLSYQVTNSTGCTVTDNATVTIITLNPSIGVAETSGTPNDGQICEGASATLSVTPAFSTYTWSTGGNTSSITVSPAATTTYGVTVTSAASGCTGTTSAIVTVLPLPNASAGADQTICLGQSATLTASGGGTYNWSTGQNTAMITVNPATTTTYTVTVTGVNGCTASDQVTVNVSTPPNANAGADQTICQGQTANLMASGGGTYSWSTGQSGAFIIVTPATTTTYTVTVTGANGCTATDQVIVNVNTPPNANAGPNQNICLGQSATLTATGGGSYSWSTGQSNATVVVTPIATSTYVVTVTAANGCTDTDDVIVTVFNVPNANAGPDQFICAGSTATLTASGGNSYNWSTGQTGPSINVSPAATTTYIVTVTNTQGCSATDQIMVTVVPSLNAEAGPNQTICSGSGATLTASGGANYLWSTGQTGPSISVMPLQTTIYFVTVSDNSGCMDVDNVTVTVVPQPTVMAADTSICVGEDVVLNPTVQGGTLPLIHQWTDLGTGTAGGYNLSALNQPSLEIETSGTMGGNLNLSYVLSDANGCRDTALVTVTIMKIPVISMTSSVPVSSPGANDGQFIFTITGGVAPYPTAWSGPVTGSGIFQGSAPDTLMNLPAGTYILTVVGSSGCSTTQNFVINEAGCDLVIDSVGVQNTCSGASQGSLVVHYSGGVAPITISWSGAASGSGQDSILSNLPAGNYNLVLTDQSGCATTGTATVGNLPANDPSCQGCTVFAGTFAETDTLDICPNTSATVTHNGDEILETGQLLEFVLHDLPGNTLGNVVAQNALPIFGFDPGSMDYNTIYFISAVAGPDDGTGQVNLADSCVDITPGVAVRFLSPDAGILTFIQGIDRLCQGQPLTLTTDDLGNIEYLWLLPNGDTARTSVPDYSISSVQPADAGEYFVEAHIGDCFFDATGPFVLQVDGLPAGEVIYAGQDTFVCNAEVRLNATPITNGGTGRWQSLSGAHVANAADPHTLVTALLPGENRFVWRVETGACNSVGTDTVHVFFQKPIVAQPDFYTLERINSEIFVDILKNDDLAPGVPIHLQALDEPEFGQLETLENAFRYYELEGRRGVITFRYEVCYQNTDCPNACDTALVTINVLNLPYLGDAITANGDGINDRFTVLGYKPGDNEVRMKLTISNQWGEVVFESNDYTNQEPWNGIYQGKILPQGAYYAQVEVSVRDQSYTYSQTVYIVK